MSSALWGGRFEEKVNELVQKLSESVSFDKRLAQHDIRGSLAHVKMLATQKIIPQVRTARSVHTCKEPPDPLHNLP
jgi:argininosuccinate lyase